MVLVPGVKRPTLWGTPQEPVQAPCQGRHSSSLFQSLETQISCKLSYFLNVDSSLKVETAVPSGSRACYSFGGFPHPATICLYVPVLLLSPDLSPTASAGTLAFARGPGPPVTRGAGAAVCGAPSARVFCVLTHPGLRVCWLRVRHQVCRPHSSSWNKWSLPCSCRSQVTSAKCRGTEEPDRAWVLRFQACASVPLPWTSSPLGSPCCCLSVTCKTPCRHFSSTLSAPWPHSVLPV